MFGLPNGTCPPPGFKNGGETRARILESMKKELREEEVGDAILFANRVHEFYEASPLGVRLDLEKWTDECTNSSFIESMAIGWEEMRSRGSHGVRLVSQVGPWFVVGTDIEVLLDLEKLFSWDTFVESRAEVQGEKAQK